MYILHFHVYLFLCYSILMRIYFTLTLDGGNYFSKHSNGILETKQHWNGTWNFCFRRIRLKHFDMMATYLRCWQRPGMKLFQLGWRQSRCRAHSEPGSSSSSTARPRCSQSSCRIGQSGRFHCRLCPRWWTEVGNLTPEPPASPSYLQNPSRTREASVWSLELFYVLLMRKEDQETY